MSNVNYPLFSVIGIEIEYMLVDKHTLNIQPKSDRILTDLAGKLVNEAMIGEIAVSNELVMHVLELKNSRPRSLNEPIVDHFQQAIHALQPFLQQYDLLFMPSAAHPWMNPNTETQRWPHGNNAIYQQFDNIFDCRGHGWANLQSMHVNLPFANDDEFFQLHSAIRLLLPLLPSLAASSPLLDGQFTPYQDARLYYYGVNQSNIPAISGSIIPEFIRSPQEYHQHILEPMYAAIDPYDPDKILQFEWLNSRGAIPKFHCNAIEIRILDSQECVNADLAIARLIVAVLKKWLNHSDYLLTHPCPMEPLKNVYQSSLKQGLNTPITDPELLKQWQVSSNTKTIRQVLSQLIEQVSHELEPSAQKALETILERGNLSERLMQHLKGQVKPDDLHALYRKLTHCLLENEQL